MPTAKKTDVMIVLPTIRQLVDAGAHFGHRRSRSHPNARQFVYTIRDRVLVINLEDTLSRLKDATQAAGHWAAEGKTFLFVGTKPQAAEAIKTAAQKAGMPYINQRWLGGTLTNYATIRRNLDKLARLDEVAASAQFEAFTKKERVGLQKMFGGIASLSKLPDVLVVVDLDQEKIAVGEANKIGLPIIALVDTNVDPNLAEYPIPGNDDSRKTIELVLNQLAEAITQGVAMIPAPVAQPAATKEVAAPAPKIDNYDEATTAEKMASDLGQIAVETEPDVETVVPATDVKTKKTVKKTAKSK